MNYFERTLKHFALFDLSTRMGLGLRLPTKANAQMWLDRIENELSPENLTCDGELPRSEINRKEAELVAAAQHCRTLLGHSMPSNQFSVTPAPVSGSMSRFNFAVGAARRAQKRERTKQRMDKLRTALHQGFLVGVRVIIKNGVRGKITKINRTRVAVAGDDGRRWSVPPSCMILEQPIR